MTRIPKTIYQQFGARLAMLRQVCGLSQAELTKRLGMPQSTYASYETGKRKVTLELIDKFAAFSKVSPTFLVTGTELREEDGIRLEELTMIRRYRALRPDEREAVDLILRRGAAAVVILNEEASPD